MERGVDVALGHLAGRICGLGRPAEGAILDLVEARVAADGERAAAHDLHAVVGGRVV